MFAFQLINCFLQKVAEWNNRNLKCFSGNGTVSFVTFFVSKHFFTGLIWTYSVSIQIFIRLLFYTQETYFEMQYPNVHTITFLVDCCLVVPIVISLDQSCFLLFFFFFSNHHFTLLMQILQYCIATHTNLLRN